MTENTDLNFIQQEVVSLSEQEFKKKLEIVSFVIAGLTLLITVIVSGLNVYKLANLTKVKNEEANLIAQIQAPDSKNKESLFFLTKNRLAKINDISSARTKMYSFLRKLKDINSFITIEDFSLNARSAKVTFSTDNYQKFQEFLNRISDFNIDKKSVVINQVTFSDGRYKIPVQFLFGQT